MNPILILLVMVSLANALSSKEIVEEQLAEERKELKNGDQEAGFGDLYSALKVISGASIGDLVVLLNNAKRTFKDLKMANRKKLEEFTPEALIKLITTRHMRHPLPLEMVPSGLILMAFLWHKSEPAERAEFERLVAPYFGDIEKSFGPYVKHEFSFYGYDAKNGTLLSDLGCSVVQALIITGHPIPNPNGYLQEHVLAFGNRTLAFIEPFIEHKPDIWNRTQEYVKYVEENPWVNDSLSILNQRFVFHGVLPIVRNRDESKFAEMVEIIKEQLKLGNFFARRIVTYCFNASLIMNIMPLYNLIVPILQPGLEEHKKKGTVDRKEHVLVRYNFLIYLAIKIRNESNLPLYNSKTIQ